MSQVDKLLEQISELSKAEQLGVYLDLHRRLQDEVDQLGFLQLIEEAFVDWNNPDDDVYNGNYPI